MKLFFRNDSGRWDCDFEFLHSQTTYDFSQQIERVLATNEGYSALDVQYLKNGSNVRVEIYYTHGVDVFVYNTELKKDVYQYLDYETTRFMLNHAKALGC